MFTENQFARGRALLELYIAEANAMANDHVFTSEMVEYCMREAVIHLTAVAPWWGHDYLFADELLNLAGLGLAGMTASRRVLWMIQTLHPFLENKRARRNGLVLIAVAVATFAKRNTPQGLDEILE